MAKCMKCGKSTLIRGHVSLADGAICTPCYKALGFKITEAYLMKFKTYNEIAAGKDAMSQIKIVDSSPASLSTYKIVGTSYENDHGDDIQEILSKYVKKWFSDEKLSAADIREELEYDDRVYVYPTMDITVDLIPTTFDGEPAVKVMLEDDPNEYIHIGWIPKRNAAEVINLIENYDCGFSGELIGGPYKYEDEDGKLASDVDGYGGKVYISYK